MEIPRFVVHEGDAVSWSEGHPALVGRQRMESAALAVCALDADDRMARQAFHKPPIAVGRVLSKVQMVARHEGTGRGTVRGQGVPAKHPAVVDAQDAMGRSEWKQMPGCHY